ncbi:MAG: CidA/LrgA family protein [Saccharospirillaceae bacterium]|jgi:holin-like protein|nr:CidA/LrgA family protein [Saccharospirillaceae bacterium]
MPGLLLLFVFLLVGGALQSQFSLPVPDAIVGMLLLLLFLVIRGKTPDSLQQTTKSLSPLLPLFLIPVSSGIITQKEIISDFGFELLVILAISLVPGIVVTGLIMTVGRGEKS